VCAAAARPQQRTHIDSAACVPGASESALVWKKHKPQVHSRSFPPSKFTLSANKRVADGGWTRAEREHRSRSHFSPSTELARGKKGQISSSPLLDLCGNK